MIIPVTLAIGLGFKGASATNFGYGAFNFGIDGAAIFAPVVLF